jgi:periplasmic protein TonB
MAHMHHRVETECIDDAFRNPRTEHGERFSSRVSPMAPTKESDTLPPVIEKSLSGDSGRAQPVALEVPVTVNGARAVEGSNRREPFSETTQTVLVFGHGAVIRLASAVASGQLLFLTNEKTKKEVVCQVVKSKNYRNVSGYVELEFTETMPGFWGMRFPNERVAQPPSPAAPSAPAASGSPVAPKAAPIASSSTPKAPEVQTAPVSESHEVLTTDALRTMKSPATLTLPRTLETKPAQLQPKISLSNEPSWTSTIPHVPESKPAAPVAIKSDPLRITPASPAPGSHTESAHSNLPLTERLSALEQKLKTPLMSTASVAPLAKKPAAIDLASKVVEIAKADSSHSKPLAKKSSPLASSLDVEEVKIPTWLEPLAHNADPRNAPEEPSHEETTEIEIKEVRNAREVQSQHIEASPVVSAGEANTAAASEVPLSFPIERDTTPATPAFASGKKGIVIGAVAAGILVLVGSGAWYARRQAAQAATPASAIAASQSSPVQAGSQPALSNSAAVVPGSDATPQTNVPGGSAAAQPARAVDKSYAAQDLAAYKKLAEPEPKKPTIGEVHLASPTLNRNAVRPDSNPESGPSLADTQTTRGSSDASLIAGNNLQPVAPAVPLPVGGDVKTARLLSTVPPVYPSLARSQRIFGDVRVDALIDASGRVSAMKVVSGPTLLQQAAMDSLRQWKYQPATLNGTAVPMHLTVTVQFHLQ